MFSRDMTRVHIIDRHTPVKLLDILFILIIIIIDVSEPRPECHSIVYAFLSSAVFFYFKIIFFDIILSEIPSEYQTVWIQIRPDIFVGPDLGPHYFQGYIVSADAISGQ